MSQPNRKIFIVVSLLVMGLMVLGVATAMMSDFSKLVSIFHQIRVEPLLFALFCTATAYVAFTLSFNGLFEMTPYRIPFARFFSIMFISQTINSVASLGGWAGVALRSYLLKQQQKIPYSVTIPLSFAQNLVFNLVLSCVCFGGLIYLREHPEFVGGSREFVVLAFMLGLLGLVGGMLLIFFNGTFRRWLLRQVITFGGWLNRRILKNKSSIKKMVDARNRFDESIKLLHQGWLQLLLVVFWVAMDWVFTALTLYCCFHAVGVDLPLGLLMVGFTVFFLTSTINPVPAGLGVSEAALTVVFTLLGVESEKTVWAALLFRLIFFLLPLATSTALYLDTMRAFLKSEEAIEKAVQEAQ